MTAEAETTTVARAPLSRERVLLAAVKLADEGGIESVSMRKIGVELGVEAMSLYNHVANKEEILDGMLDSVVAEVELEPLGGDWQAALRHRILAARQVMAQHQWAPALIETRTSISQTMMAYMDSIIGICRDGGLSIDLAHHAMHALGSRVLGFSQELFNDSGDDKDDADSEQMMRNLGAYPNILAVIDAVTHQGETTVGGGCDDDIEFVFALDLILNGLERLRQTT